MKRFIYFALGFGCAALVVVLAVSAPRTAAETLNLRVDEFGGGDTPSW